MDAQPNRVGATHHQAASSGEVSRRRLLVVACAASAGLHAALVPTHADQSEATGGLFALSALVLIALALALEHGGGRRVVAAAALLLAALLAAYAATRFTAIWPVDHAEPVDAIGAVTKLFEAAGLVLALSLLQAPRTAAKELAAPTKGVDP